MSSSRLNRFLKYINYLIAVLLLGAVGLIFWFVWRPMPKTSGTLEAPVLRTVKVVTDALGVPHISAESMDDVLFAQGYAHAQERLWQMDALRRAAAGELSEIVGRVALENDREMRRLRMRRAAEQHRQTLTPAEHAVFAAYARGVNWFIQTQRGNLPIEFTLLGYDPRPWTVVDSILAGLYLYRELTTTWDDDLRKQTLLTIGEPKLVNMLLPVRTGRELQPGSNAWAISGKHTASGKPILANDPHLENSIPSKWFLIHLQAESDFNVAGASIPGLPGVIIGHNERIAWGVTNSHFDVQDLYAEKLNITNGQYLFKGQVENSRTEREIIRIKGERPVEFANLVTRHGPLWNTPGAITTLRWTATEPGLFAFPFLEINAATNWQQFRSAISRFLGPAQNFVYADVDGNIGFQVAGRLPIRRNFDGDIPVDGSSGEYEWDGYIPFDELPSAFNPPSGYIVSANQNPFPEKYPYRVNGTFGPPYRAEQIAARLRAKEGWKPEEMIAIQKDVYSSLSHYLARQAVAVYDKRGTRNPNLADAARLLREWNGQMDKDQAAPLIATLLFQHLRTALAERVAPGKATSYESQMAGAVIERLLRTRPDGLFSDYDQVILRAFVDAVEEGKRLQGRAIDKWKYGAYVELAIIHPVLGRVPVVGKYFNIGPLPQSGSSTTVKQTTRRLGPSMRFVADLSNWDNTLQNLLTGESGHPLSRHYKDQFDEHYTGRSFRQSFTALSGDTMLMVPLNTK